MNELKLLFDEFNEKPIAYNRIYAKITGSVTAGLLLSQLVYWSKAMKNKEFYKTDNDFCEELCMGLYELRGAKKKLLSLKIIIAERKGVPAKTYYKVNIDEIIRLITSCGKNPQLELGKTHNLIEQKPTTITENNTENTTDTPTQKLEKTFTAPISDFSEEKSGEVNHCDIRLRTIPANRNAYSSENVTETQEEATERDAILSMVDDFDSAPKETKTKKDHNGAFGREKNIIYKYFVQRLDLPYTAEKGIARASHLKKLWKELRGNTPEDKILEAKALIDWVSAQEWAYNVTSVSVLVRQYPVYLKHLKTPQKSPQRATGAYGRELLSDKFAHIQNRKKNNQ